jgi:hypothetical protein
VYGELRNTYLEDSSPFYHTSQAFTIRGFPGATKQLFGISPF